MQLVPYLSFNGQCEEAFRFYEACFGGKIAFMMNYGDSPMAAEAPAEWSKKIMHVTLVIGGQLLQGTDMPPGQYHKPQGISVALNMKAAEAVDSERIFNALAENGEVHM